MADIYIFLKTFQNTYITVLSINKKGNLKSIIGFWLGHWLDELKIFVLTEIKKMKNILVYKSLDTVCQFHIEKTVM